MRGANGALEAGGESGLRKYVSDAFGERADEVLGYLDNLVPCSFSADTLILTKAGLHPIIELLVGDVVYAYNEETGELGWYPVTATMAHLDPVIVHLTIDGELIVTTPEHPFYELGAAPWLAVGQYQRGWTDAGELEIGDLIWQADGTTGTVESVEVMVIEQWMYDLTVDEAHTFFVSESGWLVHNTCLPRNLQQKAKRLKINPNSDTGRQILENLGASVRTFIGNHRKGGINREFPSEFLDLTVEEALRQGGTKVRKLLTDGRFAK